MLHKLDSLNTLRPLINGMNIHLILESIIAGSTHGVVYGNAPDQPSAALCRYKSRFYLLGQPDPDFADDLKTLFENEIAPQAAAEGHEAGVWHYESEIWSPTIEKVAARKRSLAAPRRYLRREAATHPYLLPKNTSIQPIDPDLLAQRHLENIDLLVEEIQSERDDVADFLGHSFGVCAVVGDTIAGLCTSEFNTGARCEVGIMTMESYQRQGIATALAHALAAEAASRGITEIGWHCWSRNQASVATALKAGFTSVQDYPSHVIWYTAEE